ncbi:MAG: hypothetical protein ACLVJH_14705 [Faecalibacterium prausnitzii]
MLRIGGVVVLLPRFGMRGFLAVILLSSFYTCAANTGRLLLSSGTGHAFRRWLGAPAAGGCAGRGGWAWRCGSCLRTGFAGSGPVAAGGVERWAAAATAVVFLLAAWPLGPWRGAARWCCGRRQTGKTGNVAANVKFSGHRQGF